MNWSIIVCALTVMCIVGESDSFKILKKLRDILHPTVSTTVVLPTVSEYESQHGNREDESDSREQKTSPSRTKAKNSEENLSISHSSEDDGGGHSTKKTPDGIGNERVKSTTIPTNYEDLDNNNEPHQSVREFKGVTTSTTLSNYDGSNSLNKTEPSSTFGGYNSEGAVTTTTQNYVNSFDQNNQYQPSNYDNYNNVGEPTTTQKSNDVGQNQNNEDQSSVFSNFNNDGLRSTTTRNYESSYDGTRPEQSSSLNSFNHEEYPSSTVRNAYNFEDVNSPDQSSFVDGFSNNNIQTTTPRNDGGYNQNMPGQSSSYSSEVRTTTATYGYTNPKEVQPDQSKSSDGGPSVATSTTTTTIESYHNRPQSSLQGGNQQKLEESSGLQSSNSTLSFNQTTDDGTIIFPDHPSLNPTPETERVFGEGDPKFKSFKTSHSTTTRVPVPDIAGRRMIVAPSGKCGEGKTLDNKGKCRAVARK